jgi:hypothetical protein
MRPILRTVSILSLVALILPSALYLAGSIELDTVKTLMVLATLVWFVTACPVMWKDNGADTQDTG